ncbi:MAG TPA: F0F1 ATP synthase subunit delta [Patescibacteria group bacterium]|nr:F0F1 ATP synthase subunit delta [Patescibacteria group bacterium]
MEPRVKREIAPKIGKLYAHAALEIAKEYGAVPQWAEKLEVLAEVVKMDDIQKILRDSRLAPADLKEIMKPVCDKLELDDLQRDFVNHLIGEKKLSYMPWIFSSYVRQRKAMQGEVDITLTSAFPMDVETSDMLIRHVRDKFNIVAGATKVDVDPALIGGLIIKVGDRVIDQSTRGYIERKRNAPRR